MAFTLKNVKCLLEKDLVSELKNVQEEIFKKIKLPLLLSNGRLYNLLTVVKSVRRDFSLERDVPKDVSPCMALR